MDKYYIPKLEEFYIGFEHESNINGEGWKVDIFEPNEVDYDVIISAFYGKIIPECYRVKFLDITDVESFGFKHLPKKSLKNLTERFEIKGLYRRINEQYNDIMYWNVYLEYGPDIHRVIIRGDISDGSTNEKFFEGIIKNKSELKVLLTQLNII